MDAHPIRLIYQKLEEADYPVQMAVSVPKRLFRRAVDRNLLKRRIKEAYRLKKPALYEELGSNKLVILIQFRGKKIVDYPEIDSALEKTLAKLKASLKLDSTE